jgi:hypothetical protein
MKGGKLGLRERMHNRALPGLLNCLFGMAVVPRYP